MKSSISIFKILPLFFLFLFATFPHVQENLHMAFVHQKEISHSHGQDGVVHDHHPQDQHNFSEKNNSDEHQHFFKEFSAIFLRAGTASQSNSIEKTFFVTVISFELWSALLEQPILKSCSYRGPPDHICFACQEIILSHPNKAPPLA